MTTQRPAGCVCPEDGSGTGVCEAHVWVEPAGPFPPSTRGNQTNVGISPRDLFAKAFRAGWNEAYHAPGTLDECLADALKKEGL